MASCIFNIYNSVETPPAKSYNGSERYQAACAKNCVCVLHRWFQLSLMSGYYCSRKLDYNVSSFYIYYSYDPDRCCSATKFYSRGTESFWIWDVSFVFTYAGRKKSNGYCVFLKKTNTAEHLGYLMIANVKICVCFCLLLQYFYLFRKRGVIRRSFWRTDSIIGFGAFQNAHVDF